jgi:hypothetical protein
MAIANVLGSPVPIGAFVLEGIILSSACPVGQPLPCRIEIPIDEFISILDGPYNSFAADVKDWPVEDDDDALGIAGYPPLAQMLHSPTLLLHAFEALRIEFFSHFSRGQRALYCIKAIKNLRVEGQQVAVEASCVAFPWAAQQRTANPP